MRCAVAEDYRAVFVLQHGTVSQRDRRPNGLKGHGQWGGEETAVETNERNVVIDAFRH